MKINNKGFSLVELIVVISIMGILIGVIVPSVNNLFGFEAQKATGKITSLLDDTKVEAMNRLVGEMKLEYVEGKGYYITQYLDYGKETRETKGFVQETTKVANNKVQIRYKLSNESSPVSMKEQPDKALILTYNRETGGFRLVQTDVITPEAVTNALLNGEEIPFLDGGGYCEWIEIKCGLRTRTIYLQTEIGSYIVES